jgi:hypothetical protein
LATQKKISLANLLPGLHRTNPLFSIFFATLCTVLFLELFWFQHVFFESNHLLLQNFSMVALTLWCGFLVALWLPALIVRKAGSREILIQPLIKQWALSLVILSILGYWILRWMLPSVSSSVQLYQFLKDFGFYWFVIGVLLWGLMIYVRYVRYLYIKKFEQAPKIIAISGFFFVFFMAMLAAFFVADLLHLSNFFNPDLSFSQRGLLGLHVYGRFAILATLMLGSLIWHLIRIADH